MGVLGETGRGAAQAAGVEDDVDFSVGTFSKSLGSIGGFCVSRHPELEAIRYCISAYIFTASSSPSVVASTREALAYHWGTARTAENLWNNARHLYEGLKALAWAWVPQPARLSPWKWRTDPPPFKAGRHCWTQAFTSTSWFRRPHPRRTFYSATVSAPLTPAHRSTPSLPPTPDSSERRNFPRQDSVMDKIIITGNGRCAVKSG